MCESLVLPARGDGLDLGVELHALENRKKEDEEKMKKMRKKMVKEKKRWSKEEKMMK